MSRADERRDPDVGAGPSHPCPAPTVSVVIVAYGPEEWLERSVRAVLDSVDVDVDVVLVDNGGTEGAVERIADLDGVTVIHPSDNVGFARGCNLGAAASTGEYVALINPDAVVEPDALRELLAVAARPGVGLATASLRLDRDPDRLNSAGNVVHFSGMSWSGWFDELASAHPEERRVAAASGAALACRREVWQQLRGFSDEFFAYCEDADLSLRAWQQGLEVVYVPGAVVVHRYEFSRNPLKFRLLERNRWIMTLSCFSRSHLAAIAPVLILIELATLAFALRHGWLREKVAAYRWLYRRHDWLRARRTRVRSARREPAVDLLPLLDVHLRPANLELPAFVRPFDHVLVWYWRIVRRAVKP